MTDPVARRRAYRQAGSADTTVEAWWRPPAADTAPPPRWLHLRCARAERPWGRKAGRESSVQRHAVGRQRLGDGLEVGASAAHAGRDAQAGAAGEQAAAGVTGVDLGAGLHEAADGALGVVDGDVGGLHGAAGQLGRGAALADVLADGGVRRGADGLRRAVPQRDGAGCAAGVVADQAVVVAGEAGVDRGADVPLG